MSVLSYHFCVGICSDVREVRYERCVTDLGVRYGTKVRICPALKISNRGAN